VLDAKKDLNVYGQAKTSSCGCDSSAASLPSQSLPISDERIATSQSCCGVEPASTPASAGDELSALLSRCDANEFAASARVFAVKPA
jgi:hypothetical protein